MYDRQVRRRRVTLIALVVVSLILLTAYFGESPGSPLHSVQRGVINVLSPIQEGASRALKPARDLFGWFGDTLDAKKERDQLRAQRDALLMEIHDGVSASLARAAILLADGTAVGGESASHARDAVRDGLEEVRAITRLLAPKPTDWTTLSAEIRRAMADGCAAAKIKIVFESTDAHASDAPSNGALPPAVAHTLRRIAREATTNILKHAGASTITCKMHAADDA